MTDGYLVDTNVISELARRAAQPEVRRWAETVDPGALFISVITIGELRKGIVLHPDPIRRARLEQWKRDVLTVWFGDRILGITEAISERWGELSARAQQEGRPLPVLDGLMAATANEYGLTVVTRNVGHFQVTGVDVLNPWPS
ncbi:MAG: type II toxin-antitoxin system VapC family toxin [Thermaerobacter sp.]|nr:type II toxin-antitoxin system VapC family toxin [Thermaerobacter sp.]